MNSAEDACCDACLTPPCGVCDGECYLQVDCYSKARSGAKCGFFWNDAEHYENDNRYANVVFLFWGSREIAWTGEECEELDQSYSIGNGEGNPFEATWTIGSTRIFVNVCPDDTPIGSDCEENCAVSEDGGNISSYDDGTNMYSGTRTECGASTNITVEGIGLESATWDNDSPPPDDYFFSYRDANIPFDDIPVFVLQPGDTLPLHGQWALEWELNYSGEDSGYPGVDLDCSVDTTGAWFSDITASDEITTGELITEITDFTLEDDDFEVHTSDSECAACFVLSDDEATAYYKETIIKITNMSATDTVNVSYFVNTRDDIAELGTVDCNNVCETGDADTSDPETEMLLPLASFERRLAPDTSATGQTLWISGITCEIVP